MTCEHRRPPEECPDCAVQVERTRVLALFDDWMLTPGGLQGLRDAVESGALVLPLDEDGECRRG